MKDAKFQLPLAALGLGVSYILGRKTNKTYKEIASNIEELGFPYIIALQESSHTKHLAKIYAKRNNRTKEFKLATLNYHIQETDPQLN